MYSVCIIMFLFPTQQCKITDLYQSLSCLYQFLLVKGKSKVHISMHYINKRSNRQVVFHIGLHVTFKLTLGY